MTTLSRNLTSSLVVIFLLFFSGQGYAEEISGSRYVDLYGIDTLVKIMSKSPFMMIAETVPGRLKPVTVGLVVDALPQRVWDTIVDYEQYPEIIPSVKSIKVLDKNEEYVTVRMSVLVLEIKPIVITMKYTMKATFHKPNRIDLSIIDGKIKEFSGSWELIPLEGGKKTMLFHTTTGDFRDAAFGANLLLKRQPELETAISLSGELVLVKAIKKKAESYGL